VMTGANTAGNVEGCRVMVIQSPNIEYFLLFSRAKDASSRINP